MTGLQLALASGTLLGLALALLVWRLAPSDPDLVDALDRLSPDHVVPRRYTPGLEVDTALASPDDVVAVTDLAAAPPVAARYHVAPRTVVVLHRP